jgi:predicted nucleotidyltransferase
MAVGELPPGLQAALRDFRRRLAAIFGDAVADVRLFGSHARGDAHEESDVDVLVVLDRAGAKERRQALDIGTDVSLEHGIVLSPLVLDRQTFLRWRRQQRPIVVEVEREGMSV